jgi:hypothetical protein
MYFTDDALLLKIRTRWLLAQFTAGLRGSPAISRNLSVSWDESLSIS